MPQGYPCSCKLLFWCEVWGIEIKPRAQKARSLTEDNIWWSWAGGTPGHLAEENADILWRRPEIIPTKFFSSTKTSRLLEITKPTNKQNTKLTWIRMNRNKTSWENSCKDWDIGISDTTYKRAMFYILQETR